VIHQDQTHLVRSDAEDLGSVPPLYATLIDEPEKGIVDEAVGGSEWSRRSRRG
jgi:hypothetical protein